ncbi:MAG: hypothetical protein V1899_00590 [Planctomycetota bacterium]
MKKILFFLVFLGVMMFTIGITAHAEEPESPKKENGASTTISISRGGSSSSGGSISFNGRTMNFNKTDGSKMSMRTSRSDSKFKNLPLNATEERLIFDVPVGGIDSFQNNGTGHKMETIFKLTEEQTKAITGIRDEYADEQKKLEQEILNQQKSLVEKVFQLRLKFEQRANDILTTTDKATKEKIDVITRNAYTEANKSLDKKNDDIFELLIRTDDITKAATLKVLEALPAEAQANFKTLNAQQQALEDQYRQLIKKPFIKSPLKSPAPLEKPPADDF